MIILRDISLRRGNKLLLDNAGVTIQPGQRLALIGTNGCGKSSLFSLLLGELEADSGTMEGLHGLQLAHMAQETGTSDLSACDYVWRGDDRLAEFWDRLTALETAGDFEQAATVHNQLEVIDGYSARRRASRLLLGLGFAENDGDRPVSEFPAAGAYG